MSEQQTSSGQQDASCQFKENLNQIIEELNFLHQVTEHLDAHIQTFRSCSKDGGCCKDMKQIRRHSNEAHDQIHDLLEHLKIVKKLLVKCTDS
ncbi:MAG: hypothetical protein LRZ99_04270 [Desulfotomaculum sp.]|nr:hypothetical protein [Desulfotomaculum sp.]